MAERWLSVDEIAAHLGVNPDTIYKWITRKSMPAHKLGRLWKFLASEVDQWVKGGLAGESEIPPASLQSKETLRDRANAKRPNKKPVGN
jgi:excisionase family DNA binding protein